MATKYTTRNKLPDLDKRDQAEAVPVTSNQRRRNQERQLAHLLRNWADIGQQAVVEVGFALGNLDKRQEIISRAIYTAAGWWDWMPNTTTIPAAELERRDVALHDPQFVKRHGQWQPKY
jgi:hypothetical protein